MATHYDKFQERKNFKFDMLKNAELCGIYELPKIEAVKYVPKSIIPFNMAKGEKCPGNKWVYFFIDDYQFERIWNAPGKYIDLLKRFEGIISTDFSMYVEMPKAQRIWNCYRNRLISYWMQQNKIKIIPVVEWSEYSDFDWCLDGLPKQSTLAIGMYGTQISQKARYGLIKGVERVCRELNPNTLVMYGKEDESIKSLCREVIFYDNYCEFMKKRV